MRRNMVRAGYRAALPAAAWRAAAIPGQRPGDPRELPQPAPEVPDLPNETPDLPAEAPGPTPEEMPNQPDAWPEPEPPGLSDAARRPAMRQVHSPDGIFGRNTPFSAVISANNRAAGGASGTAAGRTQYQ